MCAQSDVVFLKKVKLDELNILKLTILSEVNANKNAISKSKVEGYIKSIINCINDGIIEFEDNNALTPTNILDNSSQNSITKISSQESFNTNNENTSQTEEPKGNSEGNSMAIETRIGKLEILFGNFLLKQNNRRHVNNTFPKPPHNKRTNQTRNVRTCWSCGRPGHLSHDCHFNTDRKIFPKFNQKYTQRHQFRNKTFYRQQNQIPESTQMMTTNGNNFLVIPPEEYQRLIHNQSQTPIHSYHQNNSMIAPIY